jgi:hypothetical protein
MKVRSFGKGKFEIVHIAGLTVGRATYQHGGEWWLPVGRIALQSGHVGLVLSGCATARMEDGPRTSLFTSCWFSGHDSWVVGDDPYVSLHFLGAGKK